MSADRDSAGILLHLQLTSAVGEVLNVLTGREKLPGTLAEQEATVIERTRKLADAYNASLGWAQRAGKVIEMLDRREAEANRHQRRARAARGRAVSQGQSGPGAQGAPGPELPATVEAAHASAGPATVGGSMPERHSTVQGGAAPTPRARL